MGIYNGVTFTELAVDNMWRPWWEREPNITVRHIPYTSKDDIQSASRGNHRLSLTVEITSDADMDTIIDSVGTTTRALTDLYGVAADDYNSVYLLECSNLRRWDGGQRWTCNLVFMREG